jgi:hypothetical protein
MSDTPRTTEWRKGWAGESQYADPIVDDAEELMAQLERELAEVKAQRDALADALGNIANRRLNDHMGPHDMALSCVSEARESLAAVEGDRRRQ